MPKKKIYFRADAGAGIGYGHFIRSLALADMLRSEFECTIFTKAPSPYQLAEAQKVCPLVALPDDDSRFELFLTHLTGEEIVVLDNYFYSTEYQQKIKDKGCRLVCIDDIHDKRFVSDIVINHGILPASEYDVASDTVVCTSPKYALLRSPFLEARTMSKRPHSWVVTIGGLDEPNITTLAVKKLQETGATDIVAIVGDGFKHRQELASTGVNILSRISAQEMADTFAQSENVLCCASTVCYEALSQGCKVYAGWYVDNQIEIYGGLVQEQYVVPLGDLHHLQAAMLLQDTSTRPISFAKVRNHLKGLFIGLALEAVNYIHLTEEQSHQVWECRNREEIRACMSNTAPFSFEAHKQFVRSLQDQNTKTYIAFFCGQQFVASVDLVGIDCHNQAERGLFIHPDFQGMYLGKYVENHIETLAREQYHLHTLVAEVLKSNARSLAYHLAMGYAQISEDANYYYLEKQI